MKGLEKTREELNRARKYLDWIQRSKTVVESEKHWEEFLHSLERTWNKISHQMKNVSKYQGWARRGQVIALRSSDPLLSYLINARGALEHTIADVTRKVPGGIGINPAFGNAMTIDKMTMRDGVISIKSPQPIRVDFTPAKLDLLPVVNRGVTYMPPKSHLGNSILGSGPVALGQLGIDFYEKYIEEIENELL